MFRGLQAEVGSTTLGDSTLCITLEISNPKIAIKGETWFMS